MNKSESEQDVYGLVPLEMIDALNDTLKCLCHGRATLEVHVRSGKIARYITHKEISYLAPTGQYEGGRYGK